MERNKKKFLLIIGTLLIISICVGISYAYVMFTATQSGINVVNSDCFELTFSDVAGSDINLTRTFPMPEDEGAQTRPYTFTIKNICSYNSNYDVTIETLSTSTLNTNNLRVKLDNEPSNILGSISSNETKTIDSALSSKTIARGTLISNEEKTYNLRLWIDYDSTREESTNKNYEAKVVVIATVNKNDKYITLNTNGGNLSQNRIFLNIGDKLGVLPTPTKDDSDFLGWYSDSELTNAVTSDTIVTEELANLYAKWACSYNNFAGYLRCLEESTTVLPDDGTSDHNMRYTGTNPANYVNFKLSDGTYETWRVIGVFNSNSHGSSSDKVKIMRDETLGNMAYDSSNSNNWNNASLKEILNGDAYKYVGSELIDDASWKLGGNRTAYAVLINTWYECERYNIVYDAWPGKVALPYLSDFGYSIENGEKRNFCLNKDMYNWNGTGYRDVCLTSSWMYSSSIDWWTLTATSGTTNSVFYLRTGQYLGSGEKTKYNHGVRPAVYLKSNVKCDNCNEADAGTIDNPFELSLQ
ncbi:MAG: InlB B-repeat-containing protein [Bacilli bacterium]|nr:InlB B-repeat-containing protein [Bacilli bacterium]